MFERMDFNEEQKEQLLLAAQWIKEADGLLMTAGAGMGVDSGLPDFRGKEGFWRAYPALALKELRFEDVAYPGLFHHQPRLAWGFYGHRLNLYRKTEPHAGFGILQNWANTKPNGLFVFTSNVDGQFQKAGFPNERIVECHGSIHYLQCLRGCCEHIWPVDDFTPEVDSFACQLISELPVCPKCGGLLRPNILMFDDYDWKSQRMQLQKDQLNHWLQGQKRLVVIEIGAGKAIPTVRRLGEQLGVRLIRINPMDYTTRGDNSIGLGLRALQTLNGLDEAIRG